MRRWKGIQKLNKRMTSWTAAVGFKLGGSGVGGALGDGGPELT